MGNELLELSKILGDEYASKRSKWEILKADRLGQYEDEPEGWTLTIRKIKTDEVADEDNKQC